VYSQFSQQRALDMEETYRLRQRVREEREKAKLNSFVHSSGSNSAVPKEESIITILNTQFKFVDGGNKLVRVSGTFSLPPEQYSNRLSHSRYRRPDFREIHTKELQGCWCAIRAQ